MKSTPLARALMFLLAGLSVATALSAEIPATRDEMATGEIATPSLTRLSYRSSSGEDRDAFLKTPKGHQHQGAHRWPVMLFFHGDEERGDGKGDLDWVLAHGPLHDVYDWLLQQRLPPLRSQPGSNELRASEVVSGPAKNDP